MFTVCNGVSMEPDHVALPGKDQIDPVSSDDATSGWEEDSKTTKCVGLIPTGKKGKAVEHEAACTVSPSKAAPDADVTKYCGFCCVLDSSDNLLKCFQCGNSGHQQCLQMDDKLWNHCKNDEDWMCIECKDCSICCVPGNDDELLFCDKCDKGVHMYCLDPPVFEIPSEDFVCPECQTGKMPKRRLAASTVKEYLKRIRGYSPERDTKPNEAQTSPVILLGVMGPNKNGKRKPKKKKTKESLVVEFKKQKTTPRHKSKQVHSPLKLKIVEKGRKNMDGPTTKDCELFENARIQAASKLDTDRSCDGGERWLRFGNVELQTWFTAPYPEEYALLSKMFLCEFCLKYMKSNEMYKRHELKCEMEGHPPGDEIYRDGVIQMWEVDGAKAKIYCQNLCLLAKLFLDHKTLYYDVEPFLFYVLTRADEYGAHFVGYFSKEKDSVMQYNLSCLLTLPHLQCHGYGKLLIDFSYLLSRVEKRTGTPEKPLSALGLLTYSSYWKNAVLSYLSKHNDDELAIEDIMRSTGIHPSDIMSTLNDLQLIELRGNTSVIIRDEELLLGWKEKKETKGKSSIQLDESKLRWIPHRARAF
eukprot:m.104227 g.104227  ORF g.104227 m.104227 type:complete len:585 (-) comp13838_c0_seq6:1276-3030(-)